MQRAFASPTFRKVTHVIFDMDGLLLDTETLYTKATQNVVGQYGKCYDWSVKTQMMGLLGSEVAEKIVELLDLPLTPEEYTELIQEQYKILMPTASLMPGAERLVRHLHQTKIPIAVATSSSEESFDMKTRHHKDFFTLFDHIVTGGSDPEIKHGKPSPDIFLVCASRFADKPAPEDCLVLEDAPNGVKAAVSANMQVVMVPDPQVPKEQRALATLVLESLDHMKPEVFGLPPMTQVYELK